MPLYGSPNATSVALAPDLPTGAKGETILRGTISSITMATLTSAQLYLVGIELFSAQLITSISFVTGSTAVNTPTNQWFSLWSPARVQLGLTSDDTTTAWGANATKTLNLASAYTIPTTGLYYIGCMVKATVAVPTLQGIIVPNTTVLNIPPIICGNADAGLTNPASAPGTAAAITVAGNVPYAYVS